MLRVDEVVLPLVGPISIDPNWTPAYVNRMLFYDSIGKHNEAQSDRNQVVERQIAQHSRSGRSTVLVSSVATECLQVNDPKYCFSMILPALPRL